MPSFFSAPAPEDGTQIAVGATATLLLAAGARRGVWFSNLHASDAARIGGTGVTATTGYFRLKAQDTVFLPEDVIGTGELRGIREGSNNIPVLVSPVR
jgi:hypothetical protein